MNQMSLQHLASFDLCLYFVSEVAAAEAAAEDMSSTVKVGILVGNNINGYCHSFLLSVR